MVSDPLEDEQEADEAEQVGDRLVVLARELTKLHEEVLRGTPVELLEQLPEKARGEFVVIVDRPHS